MIRPVSKVRSICVVNDFQVFKGQCETTMKPFGEPVMATHEARLLIEDDRRKSPAGSPALYAIHQRSENRILQIFIKAGNVVVLPAPEKAATRFPLPKAA